MPDAEKVGTMNEPSLARSIRNHERMQQASALIGQVEDDLDRDHPLKEQLRYLHDDVWRAGYEILGDVEDAGE